MGDTAEKVFDELFPKSHKLGLSRPPFGVSGMLLGMRYTPDRMTRDAFVEIMGCGRDQTLKLKVEKFNALFLWQAIGPVDLFVYNETNDVWWMAPMEQWFQSALVNGGSGVFDDGKQYVSLRTKFFPCEPTPRRADVEAA